MRVLRVTHIRRSQGIDPVFISKAQSKARKNNPNMEKRRRQKYAGWASYMFPEYEGMEKILAARRAERASGSTLGPIRETLSFNTEGETKGRRMQRLADAEAALRASTVQKKTRRRGKTAASDDAAEGDNKK
jgi:hypothetical protein